MREVALKAPRPALASIPEHSCHAEGFSAAPRVCASSRMPIRTGRCCSSVPNLKVLYLTKFNDLGLDSCPPQGAGSEGYRDPDPDPVGAPFPNCWRAAICWASPRPAPARRRRSRCRCSTGFRGIRRGPNRGTCRALVLTPTRELAAQIAESFRTYGRFLKLETAAVFGGVSIARSCAPRQGGVDILVATPGPARRSDRAPRREPRQARDLRAR